MQIVRMIVWVLLLTALLVFSFANWDPTVTVRIWPNLVVETKRLPADVAALSHQQVAPQSTDGHARGEASRCPAGLWNADRARRCADGG